MSPRIVSLLISWLQHRSARAVVGGRQSDVMNLQAVFNVMEFVFEDARRAVNDVFLKNAFLRMTSMITGSSHVILVT